MKVKIKRLKGELPLPSYRHHGDAGVDLCNAGEDIELAPLQRCLVPTGIKVAIPPGYELQVRPRSGLALKKGLTVLNTPGTIDSSYRGEVGVIVFNADPQQKALIEKGERIAQMVLKKVEEIEWEVCEKLEETPRNEGGFGSTDIK